MLVRVKESFIPKIKTLKRWLFSLSAIFLMCLSPVSVSALSGRSSSECISAVVWAEARGESDEGRRAVAHVIINRAIQSGKTPCAVTNERGQFKQGKPPASFVVSTNGRDPTHGATYFRTKDSRMWLGFRKYIRIGGHTFYGK